MERLLPYYERELATLRDACRELSQSYPSLAGLLAGVGESTADPSVETMIQATALLTARIAKRMDDDYPQFTEALLAMVEPDLLRPTVPASIVEVKVDSVAENAALLPRGSAIHSPTVDNLRIPFSTVYEVDLAAPPPIAVAFRTDLDAPINARLPRDAAARISLAWEALPAAPVPRPLRVFVDAERALSAALLDALFLGTVAAYVQPERSSAWLPLDRPPLALAGWGDADALMPPSPQASPACRLVKEFFTFPEKFNFIELDLAAVQARLGGVAGGCTLHLVLGRAASDPQTARTLAALGPQHLRAGCTPVVNLFPQAAIPITLDHRTPDYPLRADHKLRDAFDIVGVQAARLVDATAAGAVPVPLEPLYTLRHALAPGTARYWTLRTATEPGRGAYIAVVDDELRPMGATKQTLSVDLLCSNGELAASVTDARGQPELHGAFGNAQLRFLRRPTRPYRFTHDDGIHWRLIAQLALGSRPLSSLDVDELRALLALYDVTRSAATARLIGALHALTCTPTMAWTGQGAAICLMPGIEIRIVLDTAACAGTSVYVFASLLDRFFGLYAQVNVFTRLTIWSIQDEELLRCPPRTGTSILA